MSLLVNCPKQTRSEIIRFCCLAHCGRFQDLEHKEKLRWGPFGAWLCLHWLAGGIQNLASWNLTLYKVCCSLDFLRGWTVYMHPYFSAQPRRCSPPSQEGWHLSQQRPWRQVGRSGSAPVSRADQNPDKEEGSAEYGMSSNNGILIWLLTMTIE